MQCPICGKAEIGSWMCSNINITNGARSIVRGLDGTVIDFTSMIKNLFVLFILKNF